MLRFLTCSEFKRDLHNPSYLTRSSLGVQQVAQEKGSVNDAFLIAFAGVLGFFDTRIDNTL